MPLTVIERRLLLEIGDDAQQRRLPAARRPDEGDEIAVLDLEIDLRQRIDRRVRRLKDETELACRNQRTPPTEDLPCYFFFAADAIRS